MSESELHQSAAGMPLTGIELVVRNVNYQIWAYWRGMTGEYLREQKDSFKFHRDNVIKIIEDGQFGYAVLTANPGLPAHERQEIEQINAKISKLAVDLLGLPWFLRGHGSEDISKLEEKVIEALKDLRQTSPTFQKQKLPPPLQI